MPDSRPTKAGTGPKTRSVGHQLLPTYRTRTCRCLSAFCPIKSMWELQTSYRGEHTPVKLPSTNGPLLKTDWLNFSTPSWCKRNSHMVETSLEVLLGSFPRLVIWGVILLFNAGQHRSHTQLSFSYESWGTKLCSMLLSWDIYSVRGIRCIFILGYFPFRNTTLLGNAEHSPTVLGGAQQPALWQALQIVLIQIQLRMPRTTPNSNMKVIGGAFTRAPCLIKDKHEEQHFLLEPKEP